MARGNKVAVKGSTRRRIQKREKDSDESDEEYKVGEDEEFDESDEYCSLDGDESEEILDDLAEEEEEEVFREERIVRSRNTRKTSLIRKRNQIKKPRKKRRVSYTEEDDDFDDNEEDDEADTELMSLGKGRNQIKKPRGRRRVSYTEKADYEEEEEEEEDGDDVEFMSLGRRRNQIHKPRVKRRLSCTEFEEDEYDAECLSLSRRRNQTKKPEGKRMVSYAEEDDDDDDEDDYDEDDAEFMLSESDFVDEEDEEPKMKKNEKVSRTHLRKNSFGKGLKKSRKSKVPKKPKKPKPRNRRLKRKINSSRDEAITNNDLEVEERSNKVSRQRKRRVVADSDSDFVSSASSDHEYTISEEEREQMREASVYCANLRAKLRSSSSGRQEEPMCEQRKCPVRKGKEKVEDIKDEVGKQVCGICLSEEGKRTVRGVLNCCRHHFCFSCIMEWSKVESRCPLCKQRFATITKAARSDTGFDLRTVVIPVPERDQVYQPSEEELRGYLDPYESVICTECHHGGEDAFMLLCDICDSPAHTFCVGLGREVPEGNWYCDGCRPTVFGSINSQIPAPTPDRRITSNASDLSSPIAGGFDLNELYVPETPLTQENGILPEPRHPIGEFVPAPAGTVATTLRDRRRIHRQIHHRFFNNNRMGDTVGRSSGTSASSSGIRLFGSQLDQTRDSIPQQIITPERTAQPHAFFEGREDHIMPLMRDTSLFSPRGNGVQVHNSTFTSANGSLHAELGGTGSSRLGYAQLQPCTSRSSIVSDASPSPYACREAIGPSRTSQGGLHTPY